MSTLKFKSKIEVPGIHLKGKDKNGSDIGTQIRVNSISLYADSDCEQLDMSASRILLANEIDDYHVTKIAPDLIELTSEDLETGQETTTSITSAGIVTNNITRQNTNKSIVIDSTSNAPVVTDYISTRKVTLSYLDLVHKDGNIELQSSGILLDTILTDNNIPNFVDANRLNTKQIQVTETISGELYESGSIKAWSFHLPVSYDKLISYTLQDNGDPHTYTEWMKQGSTIAYTITQGGGFTIETYPPDATLLIVYYKTISIQEALDSMERITYRYQSPKWFPFSHTSVGEFGMLIATVPKTYGTTMKEIARHEHWGFFYSKNQTMIPCRVGTDNNKPYLMIYPITESSGIVQIDIPEEDDTTYLEFVNN